MTLRIVLGLVLLGLVAGGAYGIYYVFLRPVAPPAVGGSLVAVPSSSSAASPGASSGATKGAFAGIEGAWQVDSSIGSFDDFSGSFVGYRVQEELASIGGQTAVGRTPDVTGTVTIEGQSVTAAEITADLTTLVSDDDRRDGQLKRQALETNRFPTATFVLTEPIQLPQGAADGQTVQIIGTGQLTLHGMTQPVSVPLEARLDRSVIVLTGSIDIVFADYGIAKPSSFVVLSVDDRGVMELQLFLSKA